MLFTPGSGRRTESMLGGERVRLSELWRQKGVVLEFGSFT